MQNSVGRHTWTLKLLSRITTTDLNIQQLYAELENFVQLERESVAAASVSKVLLLSEKKSPPKYILQIKKGMCVKLETSINKIALETVKGLVSDVAPSHTFPSNICIL